MTDTEKLNFILHAIVTAGGPENKVNENESWDVYALRLNTWLMNMAYATSPHGECDCKHDF